MELRVDEHTSPILPMEKAEGAHMHDRLNNSSLHIPAALNLTANITTYDASRLNHTMDGGTENFL